MSRGVLDSFILIFVFFYLYNNNSAPNGLMTIINIMVVESILEGLSYHDA